jgi:uncharacterized membrane protein
MRSILHRQPGIRVPGDNDEGAISIMAAVLAVALIMATALAVDVGRVAYTSRDQQGFTDRLVMDGLLVLEDAAESATPEELYAAVQAAAVDTESVNLEGSALGTSYDRTITNIQLGYIEAEEFRLVYDKDGQGPYYGAESPTALKVFTDSFVDFLFAIMDDEGGRTVTKDALGATRYQVEWPEDWPDGPDDPDDPTDPEDPNDPDDPLYDPFADGLISIRSRVAGFTTNSPLYQQYVEQTLDVSPGSLNATFIGYDGLATSQVALDALTGGTTFGSADEFLNADVAVADILTGMASGLRNDDAAVQAAGVAALNGMATAVNSRLDPAVTIKVVDFLSATTEDLDTLLSAEMDAHTLLSAVTMAAALANGTNAVTLSLNGSDLLGLSGLTGVNLNLTLVETPRFAFGRVDYDAAVPKWLTRAETAQVDVDLSLTMDGYYATSLLGTVASSIPGLLCGLPLLCTGKNVLIEIGAAEATASLTRITCDNPEGETDTEMVVSSDAVVAQVSGLDQTLFTTRNGTSTYGINGEGLSLTTVPGVAASADVSVSGIAVLDGLIEPVLGFVGADLGQAEGQIHEVDCGVRQLITLPTG